MKKFIQSTLTGAAALAICFSLTACNDSGNGTKTAAKLAKGKGIVSGDQIAVIPKGTSHEFWKAVHAGAVKAQRELKAGGLDIEVIWKGPQDEASDKEQKDIIENLASKSKMKGIAIAPLHQTSIASSVIDTNEKNIPVVLFDSDINPDKAKVGEDYVTFIATNNYNGGVAAAKKMSELLGGKGSVVVIRYIAGSASTEARADGFVAEITKNHKGITILSHNQRPDKGDISSAMKKIESVKEVSKADGLFCVNESVAAAGLQVIKQSDALRGKIKFVGFDASQQLIKGLEDRHVHALIVQNPMNMGYFSVMRLVDHLQGKKVSKETDTGIVVVTPENMNQAKAQEVLNPPLDKYLSE